MVVVSALRLKPKRDHDADASLGHFWSLGLEERFYFVWPVTVFLLPRRALVWWCGLLAAMAVALRWHYVGRGLDIYANTPFRLDSLAIGALLAVAIRNDVWGERLLRYGRALSWFAFAGSMISVLQNWRYPWNPMSAFFGGAWFGMLVFRGAADAFGPGLSGLLKRPLLLRYGKYSYGIYVCNLLFLDHGMWLSEHLRRRSPRVEGLVITGLVMTIANVLLYYTARASWHYYERPILRFKDRLAPRPVPVSELISQQLS